jgi:hypothetical protein
MAVRTQLQIDALVLKSKQNCFAREQNYGLKLNVGVAEVPMLQKQLVLIWMAESIYSTLPQKNKAIDMLAGDNLSTATASNLFAFNLTNATL